MPPPIWLSKSGPIAWVPRRLKMMQGADAGKDDDDDANLEMETYQFPSTCSCDVRCPSEENLTNMLHRCDPALLRKRPSACVAFCLQPLEPNVQIRRFGACFCDADRFAAE